MGLKPHSIAAFLVVAATATSALAQQWRVPEPQDYDKTHICLGDIEQPLTVELADNQGQHARGLMHRTELDEYAGMLFRYAQVRPGSSGFWMYQTLIPLDIAYLNSQGEIVKTFTMMPCGSDDPSQCRAYAPGKSYQFALEMNAGFFADHNVRLSDKITIVGDVKNDKTCSEILGKVTAQ